MDNTKTIDDCDDIKFQHRFNWLVRFKRWFKQLWTNSDKDTVNVNE